MIACLSVKISFSKKENYLKKNDKGIKQLIHEKSEFEKELKAVEDYGDKTLSIKFKIKNSFRKFKISPEVYIKAKISKCSYATCC